MVATCAVRFWVEWINSSANPSDGPSRMGWADPWTMAQQWQQHEVAYPAWAEMRSLPMRYLAQGLHTWYHEGSWTGG